MAKKETTEQTITSPVILTAKTREELAQQTEAFAKEHADFTLTFGAVGRSKDDGTYSQRIDII